MPPEVPDHGELAAELRQLRRQGLTRLRTLRLPVLADVLRLISEDGADETPGAIERLLRSTVDNLHGSLGAAAEYSFGLAAGTRDWPVGDRRKRAAQVYGVSTERFRKHHEPLIVDQLAEQLTELCRHRTAVGNGERSPRTLRLSGRIGGRTRPVVLYAMPVELLREVDVIVSPLNTHLELPQSFKSSMAATLRRTGAVLGPSGEVLDDVVRRELDSWIRENGRPGLPVAPGTVVPAGPGRLATAGIRRIYHAAVAVPGPGSSGYDVRPGTLARAVGNVFRIAREERSRFSPPLRSVCLPLLGAGRGGLDPVTGFSWILAALDRELRQEDDWELCFVARSRTGQNAIVEGLAGRG